MQINLHIGAHKTATSFMQARLAAAANRLRRDGIGFLPTMELRKFLTANLKTLPPDVFSRPGGYDRFFANGRGPEEQRRLILSDENLVGFTGELVRSGALYANAGGRMRRLRKLLAPHDVSLFFCIRSYDTSIASMYCESIRHSEAFVRFSDFHSRIDFEKCRWPGVLKRIIEALDPVETVVWRYEDFRKNSSAIMRRLAFGTDVSGGEDDIKRPSFSQAAIDTLEFISDRNGPLIAGKAVQGIGKVLPKDEHLVAFDPWTETQRRELREMYAADCKALPVELMAFESEALAV